MLIFHLLTLLYNLKYFMKILGYKCLVVELFTLKFFKMLIETNKLLDGLLVWVSKDLQWNYFQYPMFDCFGQKMKDFYNNLNKVKYRNINHLVRYEFFNSVSSLLQRYLFLVIKPWNLWIKWYSFIYSITWRRFDLKSEMYRYLYF
jgi:hypothetical protein